MMATEDRGTDLLDKETGEINREIVATISHSIITNVETGEPEQNFKHNFKGKRRVFQIPREILQENLKANESRRNRKLGKMYIGQDMVQGTQNVSPIVFMIPTLFLFPAWASILCVVLEATLHIWAHKRNKLNSHPDMNYVSPLHLISSEFCAICQSNKRMEKISKLQAERTQRRKVVDKDCIKRVVT